VSIEAQKEKKKKNSKELDTLSTNRGYCLLRIPETTNVSISITASSRIRHQKHTPYHMARVSLHSLLDRPPRPFYKGPASPQSSLPRAGLLEQRQRLKIFFLELLLAARKEKGKKKKKSCLSRSNFIGGLLVLTAPHRSLLTTKHVPSTNNCRSLSELTEGDYYYRSTWTNNTAEGKARRDV